MIVVCTVSLIASWWAASLHRWPCTDTLKGVLGTNQAFAPFQSNKVAASYPSHCHEVLLLTVHRISQVFAPFTSFLFWEKAWRPLFVLCVVVCFVFVLFLLLIIYLYFILFVCCCCFVLLFLGGWGWGGVGVINCDVLVTICSVCHRCSHTCHESNGPQITGCPQIFAVVLSCFRVAASARALSSVTVSPRAGWLHTVLLYDPTAEFNVLLHLVDVICISERVYIWPSFYTFKWSVPYFRSEPILQQTRFQVVLKHNSSCQFIQRILAVSMITNHSLFCVVFSRRYNCISFLLFKSWQVITYCTTLLLPELANLIFTLVHSSTMHITVSSPRNCHFALDQDHVLWL